MKVLKSLVLLSIMVALAACTTGAGGSSSLKYEVDALKVEVANLKDQGRLSQVGTSGSAPVAADVRSEVEYLKTNVQRLNESVETASLGGLTLKQQLEYLSARLDRLEKHNKLAPLDSKIVQTSPIPVIVTNNPPPTSGGENPYVSQVDNPYNTGDGLGGVATAPPVNTIYDDAKVMYDRKNYPEAIRLFNEHLVASPTGNQSAAAQFFIGEAYYAQNNFELAILEYQKVIQGFSKSNHVSTALLKQGNAFQALGDNVSAKNLYNKVVNNYPKSYAADLAKERLKTI